MPQKGQNMKTPLTIGAVITKSDETAESAPYNGQQPDLLSDHLQFES